MKNKFGNNQKLKSRKVLEELFQSDEIFFSYPIKCILLKKPVDKFTLPSIATVVPKRKFKKAVDRNRGKRLIREAYRLNSVDFKSRIPATTHYNIAFLYVGKTLESFETVEKGIKTILRKILPV